MSRSRGADVVMPVQVIRCYPLDCRPTDLEPLGGAGGLSGAMFWRLTTERGTFALRCWPPAHPDRERLTWIHRALRFIGPRCPVSVPVPVEANDGATFVQWSERFWELTPWLAGAPLAVAAPAAERVPAAMKALAELHLALAAFAASEEGAPHLQMGPAPGILKRLSVLENADWPGLHRAVNQFSSDSTISRPLRRLAGAVASGWEPFSAELAKVLQQASRLHVPLQPCLRDVRPSHVLFRGDRVSGILDFGALALDSIAADLARYLGGFSVEERSFWAPALNAYDTERPLSRDERVLIAAYDRSGALLNALNWLRWLAVERRSFPAAADVENRLHELRARLERYTVAPEIHPALL